MADFEEEVDVLVQRVVRDVSNAFKKNPNIDEIGIIPCPEPRYNRSPIVLVETKLGLESWCVKFLLPYLHNKLLLYRQRKHYLDRAALVDVTVTLLLLNPDFTTAWNIRKELLQCGVLSPEKDLYLGKLALTRFPKSPETWIHRRWVLLQILQQCYAQKSFRKELGDAYLCHNAAITGNSQILCKHQANILQQEMTVCSEAAGRYPSNYNAWSHRIWVLQHMAKTNVKVFLDELSSMRLWVSMHVSDHSGFHYRQFLLKALVTELKQTLESPAAATLPHPQATTEQQPGFETVPQLFLQEIELCSDLIQSFPGHETLWCHRRQVFFLWHQWRQQDHQDSQCNSNTGSVFNSCSSLSASNGQAFSSIKETREGQPHDATDAVDVDQLHDPHDTKRLKRGLLICSPALHTEHTFVSSLLEDCCNLEQRRFALAYKKWLGTIICQ